MFDRLTALMPALKTLDAKTVRAVVVLSLVALVTAAFFLLLKTKFGAAAEAGFEHWLIGFSASPLGLPVTILAFTLAAFVGAPQVLLIAASVAAFGPVAGFFYAWIATVVSAAITYFLGQIAGADALRRYGGEGTQTLSRFIETEAFMASLIIRNVPSLPFIVINMAFGAARAGFWPFLAGCALGTLPKTLVVAIFGRSLMAAGGGDVGQAVLWILVGLGWTGLMWRFKKTLMREKS